MDGPLELLSAGGPAAVALAAGAAVALVAALAAIALVLSRAQRPGSPQGALLVAVALASPSLLLVAGSELSRLPPDPAVSRAEDDLLEGMAPSSDLSRAAALRAVTGAAGLALALPLGIASCLWAGIAAGRRARRAGERARLSALAAGHGEAGRVAAQALDRSRAPAVGAVIGVLAGVAVCGLPCWGLWTSGQGLRRALGDLVYLAPESAALYLRLAITEGSRALLAGAAAGAAGAVVVGLLLALHLHVGSSRRRCLAVARAALDRAGAGPAAVRAVEDALSATGRPGPAGPAALAVALLALAAMAFLRAEALRARVTAPGAPAPMELAGR